MSPEGLLDRLRDLYKDEKVERDVWGRRQPTASEIEQALKGDKNPTPTKPPKGQPEVDHRVRRTGVENTHQDRGRKGGGRGR